MAESLKRSRGRPKGTGKDDSALLAAVADLLLTEAIKPTTAMKRLIRQGVQKKTIFESATASTLRRLQEKWGMHHVVLIADAQKRLETKKAREKEEQERRKRRSNGGGGYLGAFPQVGSAVEDVISRARALGLSEKAIGVTFPHTALSDLNPVSALANTIETAGLGRVAESALGGVASRLSSIFPSSLSELEAVGALAKSTRAWNAAALNEGAAHSLRHQELSELATGAASQALARSAQEYGVCLSSASADAASQVFGQKRQPWEETPTQKAIRKITTGTYDPLTGRYK